MPIQLRALSLMRCTALTGPSIVEFFCNSGVSVTSQLVDLCLGSDESAPVPLDCNELSTLLTKAPCFKSGKLRVLDLSSCPFDDDILMSMPVTSDLITLGLASCRNITIPGVASFLEHKAHTVECLDLTRSCAPLHQPQAGLRRSVGVPHLDPLALHFHLLNHLAPYDIDDLNARSIRLRVIELEERALQGLGAGVGAWKPIYCGRRSFYIDTSVTGMFEHGKRKLRKLEKDSDERLGLLKLTEKSTKTDASVGWRRKGSLHLFAFSWFSRKEAHGFSPLGTAFKMEVLEGHGLLGREDGLYAYRKARHLRFGSKSFKADCSSPHFRRVPSMSHTSSNRSGEKVDSVDGRWARLNANESVSLDLPLAIESPMSCERAKETGLQLLIKSPKSQCSTDPGTSASACSISPYALLEICQAAATTGREAPVIIHAATLKARPGLLFWLETEPQLRYWRPLVLLR